MDVSRTVRYSTPATAFIVDCSPFAGAVTKALALAVRIALLILPVRVALPDKPVEVHCWVIVPVIAFDGMFNAQFTTIVMLFETVVP